MENEIWKDIEGYEGLYQVSNLGRVKSFISNKVLKDCVGNRNPYHAVHLYKGGKCKTIAIHNLVGKAFQDICGKYLVGLEISHLDEDPNNNKAENLRWVKHIDNINCGSHNKKMSEAKKKQMIGNTNSYHIPIRCVETGEIFRSVKDAEIKYSPKHNRTGNVLQCIKCKTETAYGYHWKYIKNVSD